MLKDSTLTPADFFVTGGTVDRESISYVTRPADEELFNQIRAGHYCYVLTPRQMGKSSLRVRTSQHLEQVGVNTVILDLQRIIGAKSIKTLDELFYNLIYLVKEQLKLTITPETWWQAHLALSEVQRFITYLHDVVLTEVQDQVVIFIDEIDILLNYDFRDDLFAAIRAMFNARTDEPAFKRLTFVLLGVVSPADLVKNLRISPFNIGQGIDLQEFSLKDAGVLQDGQGKAIFSHIYAWTSGHPFLTQTVCLVAANIENGSWNEGQVDDLVRQKILSPEASEERGILVLQRDFILID